MGNSIQKAVLGLLLFLLVSGIYAQEDSSKVYHFEQGSEIGISYGYDYRGLWGWQSDINPPNQSLPYFSDYFPEHEILRGPIYVTGAINLSYTYRFKKWFELSGRFTYSGMYSDRNDAKTDNLLLYRQNMHSMSMVVLARFVWLNRKYVRLYSSVGLGLRAVVETAGDKPNDTCFLPTGDKPNDTCFLPTGDFTYFGIKAGGKIYGLMELSLGSNGFISGGIGFNLSKWRK